MNYFGTLFDKPSIYLINNNISEKTVSDLIGSIDTSFNYIGNLLGNLNGEALAASEREAFFNSVYGAIGSLKYLSFNEPFGVHFNGYTQTFSSATSKEFILDLIPDEDSSIQISPDTGTTWNKVTSKSLLYNDGDYFIDGRSITFYKQPDQAFSVTYSGTYPSLSKNNNFIPNVYPDPTLIEDGEIEKPILSSTTSGRIHAVLPTTTKNSDGKTFGAQISPSFNEVISAYVDGSGARECPLQYASVWIKDSNKFRKLDVDKIFILSNLEIEFTTEETIDTNNDIIVFAFSNVTLSSAIRDLFNILRDHSHDRYDISAPIDHGNLSNLIPLSDNPDIVYAGSSIKDNDHPQYFHREGYRNDPGSYNNAILGDVLIGSISNENRFENVNANSHKLVFGSITSGISVGYRSEEKDLSFYSFGNGINITSNVANNGIGLKIDGNKLYDRSGLQISSSSDITKFVKYTDESALADIMTNHIYTSNMDLSGTASLLTGATLEIGNNTILSESDSATISGGNIIINSYTNIADLEVQSANVDNLVIDAKTTISNGATLLMDDGVIDATSSINMAAPIQIQNNEGIGKLFKQIDPENPIEEYVSIYTSAMNGGKSLSTASNLFIESHLGDTYFLKSTNKVVDGNTWGSNVQELDKWPRSGIHAGQSTFSSVSVGLSSTEERRGVSFGESNHIWVTGNDTQCPSGWMILESQNGVAFINSSSKITDCSSVNYSDVSARDINSFGSITAQENIIAGKDLSVTGNIDAAELRLFDDFTVAGNGRINGELQLDNDFSVFGESKFNAPVIVNSSGVFNGNLSTNILEVRSTSSFSNDAIFDANLDVEGNLYVGGISRFNDRMLVSGQITADGGIATKSLTVEDLTVSNILKAIGGIEAGSTIRSSGSIFTEEGVIAEGTVQTNGTLSGNSVFAEVDIVSNGTLAVRNSATFNGSVLMSGDKLTVSGQSQFLDNVSISGNLNVPGNVNVSTLGVNSDVSIGGSLSVIGSIRSNGTMIIEGGGVEADYVNIAGQIQANSVEVTNQLNGDIATFDTLNVAGTTTTDILNAKSADVRGDALVSGELEIRGPLVQTTSDPVEISGNAEFDKTVTVNQLLTTKQIELKDLSNAANISETVITYDNIKTSEMETGSINVDNITGTSNIPITVSGKIDSANQNGWTKVKQLYNEDGAVFAKNTLFNGVIYAEEILSALNENFVNVVAKEAYYA